MLVMWKVAYASHLSSTLIVVGSAVVSLLTAGGIGTNYCL